jgi:predicted DNA-binding transcriptional regulator YafY
VARDDPAGGAAVSASSPGVFEEKSGGILFRCEVADLPWMAHKLAGLGMPFIIKRPQELRGVITQYAHQLANYAQQVDV